MLENLGNTIPIQECKSACVANPECFYIMHADHTDNHCILYRTCPTPVCRNPGSVTTHACIWCPFLPIYSTHSFSQGASAIL